MTISDDADLIEGLRASLDACATYANAQLRGDIEKTRQHPNWRENFAKGIVAAMRTGQVRPASGSQSIRKQARRLPLHQRHTKSAREADTPLLRFYGRHLVHYFILAALTNESPDEILENWQQWARKDVAQYFGAAIIEILGTRGIAGQTEVQSFVHSLETLRAVEAGNTLASVRPRATKRASSRIAREKATIEKSVDEGSVAALRDAIDSAADGSLDFWTFVKRRGDLIAIFSDVSRDAETLSKWLVALTRAVISIPNAPVRDILMDAPLSQWYFEPRRSLTVVKAALALNRSGDSISLSDLETLETSRQIFIASVLSHLESRGDARTAAQRMQDESCLNRAWRSALQVITPEATLPSRGANPVTQSRNEDELPTEIWSTLDIENTTRKDPLNVKVWTENATEWIKRASADSKLPDSDPEKFVRYTRIVEKLGTISEDGPLAPSSRAVFELLGISPIKADDAFVRPPADAWEALESWLQVFAGGRSRPSATVFGAGIAGLTAAHELVERGFMVTVVEPRSASSAGSATPEGASPQVGGIASTQWSEDASAGGRRGKASDSSSPPLRFPGEHGYRFFPSFYRHLFDSMKRTPLVGFAKEHGLTAFHQLQPTFRQVFSRRISSVPLTRARVRSLEAFRKEYMQILDGLGFEKRDLTRFFFKLLRYLMTSSERRASQYESLGFFEFLGGEGAYSDQFVAAIKAAPQALVAMDAVHCDTRTQANVYLQLLLDQILGGDYVDGVLNGPTSTAWLVHWRAHLEDLGVRFVHGALRQLEHFERGSTALTAKRLNAIIEFPGVPADDPEQIKRRAEDKLNIIWSDYFVMAMDAPAVERVVGAWDIHGVPLEIQGFSSIVQRRLRAGLCRYDLALRFGADTKRRRGEADDLLRQLLTRIYRKQLDASASLRARSLLDALEEATGRVVMEGMFAPELQISLWFKQRIGAEQILELEAELREMIDPGLGMLTLLSSDSEMTRQEQWVSTPRLPQDKYGAGPEDRFQTFTGIQYYFKHDFKVVRGHIYFPDSEWGLSAISQSQIWSRDVFPRNTVRGVLSVDIGDCRSPSRFTGKSLMDSSPDEIQAEVWRQVKEGLRTVRGETSAVVNLPLPEPIAYHLDDNLQFYGGRLIANTTPFLINNIGDWNNRPRCTPWVPGTPRMGDPPRSDGPHVWQAPHGGYRIHDANPAVRGCKVVFCGHYMRTFTRMTTMEAANESARHAVNAILDHLAYTRPTGSGVPLQVPGDYCEIWDIEQHELEDLEFFKRVDAMLFKAGKPAIADILQFDKIADLAHPELTDAQALMTALGVTIGKDWGVQPGELVSAVNGVLQAARRLFKDIGSVGGAGASPASAESPIARVMALLNGGLAGSRGSRGGDGGS